MIEIRLAAQDDLPRLLALYEHLHRTDDPLPEPPALQRLWNGMLTHPGFKCIVADLNDTLVGSCCLAILPNLTRGGRPYAVVENVVTHSDFRRQGIGTAVVKRALALAWDAGCYKVMLLTGSKRSETLQFYEHCGFKAGEKSGFVARPPCH
jgi:GNAT superfamily N-acetyltransferase